MIYYSPITNMLFILRGKIYLNYEVFLNKKTDGKLIKKLKLKKVGVL